MKTQTFISTKIRVFLPALFGLVFLSSLLFVFLIKKTTTYFQHRSSQRLFLGTRFLRNRFAELCWNACHYIVWGSGLGELGWLWGIYFFFFFFLPVFVVLGVFFLKIYLLFRLYCSLEDIQNAKRKSNSLQVASCAQVFYILANYDS